MKIICKLIAIHLLTLISFSLVYAQDSIPIEPEYMTQEESDALNQTRREVLQNMTDKERIAAYEQSLKYMKLRKAGVGKRIENMSVEEMSEKEFAGLLVFLGSHRKYNIQAGHEKLNNMTDEDRDTVYEQSLNNMKELIDVMSEEDSDDLVEPYGK